MKILIVEDEVLLAEEIAKHLSEFNYKCQIVNFYNEAFKYLNNDEFAIMLIDLKLPDGHGIDLIEHIKKKKISSGIIVISAIDELDMRIKALEAGADDFLIKPFHLSELTARLKALIRRNFQKGNNELQCNEIIINTTNQTVSVLGKPLVFTHKEYELLLYFVSNAGKVITKEAIGFAVWNNHSDMDISNEIIYTQVKNLRKKLVTAGSKDYIQSVYGVGYKFDI